MEKAVSVAAIMTAPRYECTWARTKIQSALSGLGIPLTVSGGVFYGQLMQRMMEQIVDAGNCDYILTVDFDSIFLSEHVEHLLSVAVNLDADAVAATQAYRGKGHLLGSYGVAETIEVDADAPLKVKTAHFGLTALKCSAFKGLPKPWFVSKPDPDGGWEDDRTDDDVYFWKNWEAHGNDVYLDLQCRIGHCEEMISVFDAEMNLQHLYPKDWERLSACKDAAEV